MEAQIIAPGFEEVLLIDSLNPVSMTVDHHNRIWYVEKHGEVWITDAAGRRNADPVLTLEVDDHNERGLQGIALHTDFDNQPWMYVYYAVNFENHNRVSRFKINGDLAVPGSEEILLDLDVLSAGVHNGGSMVMDSSGYLFIATGDGGAGFFAQEKSSLLGKILRIKDDGTIPEDNPWYNELEGDYRAIWCMGLRNPFNLAWDADTKRLYAGDVGGSEYEEINEILPGKNYGWPIVEGPLKSQTPPAQYQDPLYSYDHGQGCAITALHLYRSSNPIVPDEYQGKLFFSDYCGNYVKRINPETGVVEELFGRDLSRPLSIASDYYTGHLFYLARSGLGGGTEEDNSRTRDGNLWLVRYTGASSPRISVPPQSYTAPVHESATFQVRATGAPTLRYQWIVADTLYGDTQPTLTIPNIELDHDSTSIVVIVSNNEGEARSDQVYLYVTDNQRPVAIIDSTISPLTFRAGDTIYFQGRGIDEEDGELDAAVFEWNVNFHHNTHSHPVIESLKGVQGGSFIVPLTGETDTDVWYRITVQVNDSEGLIGQRSYDILPELSQIVFEGDSDAQINIDGRLRTLPFTLTSLINLNRVIQVPKGQFLSNRFVIFNSWSDGVTDNPRIVQSSDVVTRYTVRFDTFEYGEGSGLIGRYYNDSIHSFSGEPDLIRIDSIIAFQLGESSPAPGIIDIDYYNVRWTGYIKPIIPGRHEINVRTDDGVRLWIDGELVIDGWYPRPPTREIIEYVFEDTSLVPIQMDYFEEYAGAIAQLSWKFQDFPFSYIPSKQLYPIDFRPIGGRVWIDGNADNSFDPAIDSTISDALVELIDAYSGQVIDQDSTDENGDYQFNRIIRGSYVIQCNANLDDSYRRFQGFADGNRSSVIQHGIYDASEHDFVYRKENQLLLIYPNPSSQEFTITALFNIYPSDLTIVDNLGRQVKLISTSIDEKNIHCSLSQVHDGVYYLIYENGHDRIWRKIIKCSAD